ncbi:uncharacterized protein G2W53_028169 [Senna tora]|uniref:Uncharacterized protein n=1 Tax=Senna tora TaxID=362788 RepID=A0A834T3X7_9FABA|nr:uncharacterized protein G2W53_028169 [Senna tora]
MVAESEKEGDSGAMGRRREGA